MAKARARDPKAKLKADLLETLEPWAGLSSWRVAFKQAKNRRQHLQQATDWYAAARDGRFSDDVCRAYAKEDERFAERYRLLVCGYGQELMQAWHMLAETAPDLAGLLPVVDLFDEHPPRAAALAAKVRKVIAMVNSLEPESGSHRIGAPVVRDKLAEFADVRLKKVPRWTWKAIRDDWVLKHPKDSDLTPEKVRSAHRRHFRSKKSVRLKTTR